MNIKPPGSGIPHLDPVGDSRPPAGVSRTGEKRGFDAVADAARSESPEPVAQGLSGVASQYRKADLKDPAKLEAMIQGSVKELIDAGIGGQTSLSNSQKQQIGDWMGSDPMLRRQIEKYLERVLP